MPGLFRGKFEDRSMMSVVKSLRIGGRRFWGRRYMKELAKRLGTDPYTLRRWFRNGGPKDLDKRRDEMLREKMHESLRDAVSASSMLTKLQAQTSIYDQDRATRIQKLFGELYPTPRREVPVPSVDELCAREPIPLLAQCFREAMESVE
jgi:hypothetical protein